MASEQVLDVLPLYRSLGFFASRAHLNDSQLAEELEREYNENLAGIKLRTDFPGWDLSLLGMDEDRAWSYDTESVARDDGVYAELVERVGRISRGAFRPTNVEEIWDGPFGPIHLRFEASGQPHQVDLGENADRLYGA